MFLWCVLRAFNPKRVHPERLDKELMEKENTLNICYPVSLKDLNKFEKQNPNITITVFGKAFIPLETAPIWIGIII